MQCNAIRFNSQFEQNRCSIFFALCTPKMRTATRSFNRLRWPMKAFLTSVPVAIAIFPLEYFSIQFNSSNQIKLWIELNWIVLKNLQNIFAASMKILLWICFHCHSFISYFSCSLRTNCEHSLWRQNSCKEANKLIQSNKKCCLNDRLNNHRFSSLLHSFPFPVSFFLSSFFSLKADIVKISSTNLCKICAALCVSIQSSHKAFIIRSVNLRFLLLQSLTAF